MWGILFPAIILLISFVATLYLYRHFSKSK